MRGTLVLQQPTMLLYAAALTHISQAWNLTVRCSGPWQSAQLWVVNSKPDTKWQTVLPDHATDIANLRTSATRVSWNC